MNLTKVCVAITIMSGIGTVGLAVLMSVYPDAAQNLHPVMMTFMTLFGMGASILYKGFGGRLH